jgi:hypothetical protein
MECNKRSETSKTALVGSRRRTNKTALRSRASDLYSITLQKEVRAREAAHLKPRSSELANNDPAQRAPAPIAILARPQQTPAVDALRAFRAVGGRAEAAEEFGAVSFGCRKFWRLLPPRMMPEIGRHERRPTGTACIHLT